MAARIRREVRKGRPKGYGFRTRLEGRRLRRIKGARHAHETIRASGRVPGEEARAQVLKNRTARQHSKNLAEEHGSLQRWRTLSVLYNYQ